MAHKEKWELDLTIGIDMPLNMAKTAEEYKNKGVRIMKIKPEKMQRKI